MNRLRLSLLAGYLALTAPGRRRAVARLAAEGRAPVFVLFYHRVADHTPNAWTLSSREFRRQVDWLAGRCEFVSLAEAQRRLNSQTSYRPAVTLTFDDGYGDNCETAIPLLLRRRIPFTYFVSTQIVHDQSAFPHDLAAGVRLRPNTITELRAMADAGVELGAHTRTHADLGRVSDPAELDDEVGGSKRDLEGWIGRRVRYFAFPFGLPKNLTPAAVDAARRAGFEGVCSAYGGYNLPDAGPRAHGAFHLRRFHGDPEWARFVNWMTFDPRKRLAVDPVRDDELLASSASGDEGPSPVAVAARGRASD